MMPITLTEFKAVLKILKERDLGLKVRTHSGWSNDYLHVIGFIASASEKDVQTFSGIVLSNMTETEGIMINNISSISAFQLEHDCSVYTANTVYHLSDNRSLKAIIID